MYTLVSVMCERIDGLYYNSENLRSGIHGLGATLVADFGNINCQFSLLRDTLGVSLRNPWEGIVFFKDLLEESLQRILPTIKKLQQPLTPTQVNHLIMSTINFSTSQARIQSIESFLL